MQQQSSAWWVYILICADNTLYTGITTDVPRRLNEHNYHPQKAAKYTRARRPVRLAYKQPCQNRAKATRCEIAIKKMSAAKKRALIQSQKNDYAH